jgi:hypothetical protein
MEILLVLLVVLLIVSQLCLPGSVFREVRADTKRRRQSSRDAAERQAQLHDLSRQEREVLRTYVLERVYEREQDPHADVIRRLIGKGILRPARGLHRHSPMDAEASAFSVAAWTRSYLVSRPELLN